MIIYDDADMETVVQETASALKESARHIGKVDRHIRSDQIEAVEAAIAQLQNTLELKKRVNNANRA